MFAHARKLKEEREASRRRLAEELEALRFRLGSDVFRARQSAITTERTALDRILQLQEKAALTALEAEREKEETAQMTARMAAGYDRERIEAEAKRRLQQELRTTWSQQTAVRGDLRSAERRVESEEERRMLEADRAAAEEQRRAAEARRTGAVEEYRKTQAYNATVKAQRDAASKAVFDAEVADLEATLKREADEDAAEKAAAMARKREAAAFKKQLEEQMAIQSEDASWMDKFYTAEADKEWAKRQAKWDAEAAARAALNAEVAATREMQLKERDRHKSLEAASDARQMQAWHEARAAAEAKERAAAERRQQQLDLQRGYTEQQMAERARAREAERQAAYLEWRLQQKQEKEYQSKVDALLRVSELTRVAACCCCLWLRLQYSRPLFPHLSLILCLQEMPAETTHTRKKTGLW